MNKQLKLFDDTDKGAIISLDKQYRYRLWRIWNTRASTVLFIMLNASTADAEKDDPTVRRCVGFAKSWGFGGLYIGNLFAYRTMSPKILSNTECPVGLDNLEHIMKMIEFSTTIVLAHGNIPKTKQLSPIIRYLKFSIVDCLGVTKNGSPRHPLYIKKDKELERFDIYEFWRKYDTRY